MTLEQIRCNIGKDSMGMLSNDEIVETMKAIDFFKFTHHYLPVDVDEWFDMIYESYLEEHQEQLAQQAAYEEYRDFCWECLFKD